jgi:hypothetical protein
MDEVQMPIVQIIPMIVVPDTGMTAIIAMNMGVVSMNVRRMRFRGARTCGQQGDGSRNEKQSTHRIILFNTHSAIAQAHTKIHKTLFLLLFLFCYNISKSCETQIVFKLQGIG